MRTETAPRTERTTSSVGSSPKPSPSTVEPANPVVAPVPVPVPVPEAKTPPQRESKPTPEPREQAPTAQPAPSRTAPVEKVDPEPAAAVIVAEPVVVAPEVLQRVEPQYSAKAVKGLDNPVVALRVLVDQQGKIARVLVDEGIPGSELEGAAISAVLRWRFRPATEDGVPVKAWTTVRFVFED